VSTFEQLEIENHATIIHQKRFMVEPPKLIPEILSAKLKGFELRQKWIAKVARTLRAANP